VPLPGCLARAAAYAGENIQESRTASAIPRQTVRGFLVIAFTLLCPSRASCNEPFIIFELFNLCHTNIVDQ